MGTPKDTLYFWGEGAHEQKSEHYFNNAISNAKCATRGQQGSSTAKRKCLHLWAERAVWPGHRGARSEQRRRNRLIRARCCFPTHKKSTTHNVARFLMWWGQQGSNLWPRACKARALPAELYPQLVVTPTGFEPMLPPWKGDVLTTWPRGHEIRRFVSQMFCFGVCVYAETA